MGIFQLLEEGIILDLFHSAELHLGHILGSNASSLINATHKYPQRRHLNVRRLLVFMLIS